LPGVELSSSILKAGLPKGYPNSEKEV
jgi:hypothetical protein